MCGMACLPIALPRCLGIRMLSTRKPAAQDAGCETPETAMSADADATSDPTAPMAGDSVVLQLPSGEELTASKVRRARLQLMRARNVPVLGRPILLSANALPSAQALLSMTSRVLRVAFHAEPRCKILKVGVQGFCAPRSEQLAGQLCAAADSKIPWTCC